MKILLSIIAIMLSLSGYSQLAISNPRLDPISYDYKSPTGVIKARFDVHNDHIDIYSSKKGVMHYEGRISTPTYNKSYLDEVSPRINREIRNNPMIMTPEKAMQDYHRKQENMKIEGDRAWKRVVESWK